MPNFSAASSFGNIDEEDCKEGSPRRGIRFSEKGHMMVKIGAFDFPISLLIWHVLCITLCLATPEVTYLQPCLPLVLFWELLIFPSF
jgi:hypothetical protein